MDGDGLDSVASRLNCTDLLGLIMEEGLLGDLEVHKVRDVVDFDLTWGTFELDETLVLDKVREAVAIDELELDVAMDEA